MRSKFSTYTVLLAIAGAPLLQACGGAAFTSSSAERSAPQLEGRAPAGGKASGSPDGSEPTDGGKARGSASDPSRADLGSEREVPGDTGTNAAAGDTIEDDLVPTTTAAGSGSGSGSGPGSASVDGLDTEDDLGVDGTIESDDGASKAYYKIPRQLTAFYKKYQGSTNYYGKVQGDGADDGAFDEIVCPSGASSANGTAKIYFLVKIGATWTKFTLGATVPLDPTGPILAKIRFNTIASDGASLEHVTEDETIDIRSYFGPHPQYPAVSIPIAKPGTPGLPWQVGIGRGHDATRHPPTPDNTYMTPAPHCG